MVTRCILRSLKLLYFTESRFLAEPRRTALPPEARAAKNETFEGTLHINNNNNYYFHYYYYYYYHYSYYSYYSSYYYYCYYRWMITS